MKKMCLVDSSLKLEIPYSLCNLTATLKLRATNKISLFTFFLLIVYLLKFGIRPTPNLSYMPLLSHLILFSSLYTFLISLYGMKLFLFIWYLSCKLSLHSSEIISRK